MNEKAQSQQHKIMPNENQKKTSEMKIYSLIEAHKTDAAKVTEAIPSKGEVLDSSHKAFKYSESRVKTLIKGGLQQVLIPEYQKYKNTMFETLKEACKKDPAYASLHCFEKRCWFIIQKEFKLIQATQKSKPSIVVKDKIIEFQDYIPKLCNELLEMLQYCYNSLQESRCLENEPITPTSEVRKLGGHILLYLGDICRYKCRIASKDVIEDYKKLTLNYYYKANACYPFEGQIYNQIAMIFSKMGDPFNNLYFLIRSISCQFPFISAMELLMIHFNKINVRYHESKNKSEKSPEESPLPAFLTALLRYVEIIYTKIGREECLEVLTHSIDHLKRFIKYYQNIKKEKLKRRNIECMVRTVNFLIFSIHFSIVGIKQEKVEKIEINNQDHTRYSYKLALENDCGLYSIEGFQRIIKMLIEIVTPDFPVSYSIMLPACYFLSQNMDLVEHLWLKYPALYEVFCLLYSRSLDFLTKQQCFKDYKNSIISDDIALLGFIPVDSIILSKSKEQVPESETDLARIQIIVKLLEKIKCITRVFPVEEEKKSPEMPIPSISFENIKSPITINLEKPLIVVDLQNVAMKHGDDKFSCKGIEICFNYWTNRRHKVVGFAPEFLLNEEKVNQKRKLMETDPELVRATHVPDNVPFLKELHTAGLLVSTPAQDYDDIYCIEYAKAHNGYIVSNDKFRDYVNSFPLRSVQQFERKWLNQHCISFTFRKDEFLPNPGCDFFKFY